MANMSLTITTEQVVRLSDNNATQNNTLKHYHFSNLSKTSVCWQYHIYVIVNLKGNYHITVLMDSLISAAIQVLSERPSARIGLSYLIGLPD